MFDIFQSHAYEKLFTTRLNKKNPAKQSIAELPTSDHSVVSKAHTVELIVMDVSRTFPSLCIFQEVHYFLCTSFCRLENTVDMYKLFVAPMGSKYFGTICVPYITNYMHRTNLLTPLWQCGLGSGGRVLRPGTVCLVRLNPNPGQEITNTSCLPATALAPGHCYQTDYVRT